MKHILIEKLTLFEAEYNTVSLPPPYSFHYKITADILPDKLLVNFNLTYLDRKELTEEEILEEGFTLNDDYSFKGMLPAIWINEIKNNLEKSGWHKKLKKEKAEDSQLTIHVKDSGENEFEGPPANKGSWEYFLQEMIQAIYEISGKEMPLVIKYKEVTPDKEVIDIELQPSFSTRKVAISHHSGSGIKAHKELTWNSLKNILKAIYIPDYDPEVAEKKPPDQPGKYIDNGDGLWYKFGKGAKDPGKDTNALQKMEQMLKGLG